jgi:hypothetical protein
MLIGLRRGRVGWFTAFINFANADTDYLQFFALFKLSLISIDDELVEVDPENLWEQLQQMIKTACEQQKKLISY